MSAYKNEIFWPHGVPRSSSSPLKTPVSMGVGDSHVLLNQPAKLELVARTLNQPHATEMGKLSFVE